MIHAVFSIFFAPTEPGYYKTGHFGIRIETVMQAVPAKVKVFFYFVIDKFAVFTAWRCLAPKLCLNFRYLLDCQSISIEAETFFKQLAMSDY